LKYELKVSDWIPDYRYCERTIWERLFTRPWRPFQLRKPCGPYIYYHEDKERQVATLVANPQTAERLKLADVVQHWTDAGLGPAIIDRQP
jgi:hypothetical protein